ncbi:T9SS type A sorting domain-containing protein, partial [candidate division WOR-3 bacterium]|nr:T9SS type A sorting domain-containing protein [candidate division WOR-3 bacterium]
NSVPDTWNGRAIQNDYRITGEFGGCVSSSQDCGGGYIVYRQFGNANIWFDAYNWDGISDKKATIKTKSMNLTPNPSRGKTTLYYSLSNEGIVNVSLYDVSGKMVERLFNGTQKAGRHSINIENMTLAPGVYFVRMETSDNVETKTLTILK